LAQEQLAELWALKWEEIDFEDYEDEAATDVPVENAHVASHMLDKKLELHQQPYGQWFLPPLYDARVFGDTLSIAS